MLFQNLAHKTVYPTSYEVLTDVQKVAIDNFIDNLILQAYQSKKSFCIRDLVGSHQFKTWDQLPLDPIYQFHKAKNSIDPENRAAIDVGHLFKNALSLSKLNFSVEKDYVNRYTPL